MAEFAAVYLPVAEFAVPFIVNAAVFLAIMNKVFSLASCVKLKDWPGQRLKFIAFGLSICLVAMGSFMIFIGGTLYQPVLGFGPNVLSAGIAGVFIFDRRQVFNKSDKVQKSHGDAVPKFQLARNDAQPKRKRTGVV